MFWDNQAATQSWQALGMIAIEANYDQRKRSVQAVGNSCGGGSRFEPTLVFWHVWASPVKGRGSLVWLLMRKREKKIRPEGGREAAQQNHQSLSWRTGRRWYLNVSWHLPLNSSQIQHHGCPRWSKGRKMLKAKAERTVALNPCEIFPDRPHEFGIPIIE